MKAIDSNFKKVNDYLGVWYDCQSYPQDLCLQIDKQGKYEVVENYNIGNGCSPDIFNGLAIRWPIGQGIMTYNEAEKFIKQMTPLLDQICESYEENTDGCNYYGRWDQDLSDEIAEKCQTFESSISWNTDEILDQGEEE